MFRSALVSSVALAVLSFAAQAVAAPLLGFTSAHADAQRALEAKIDAQISRTAMRERLKLMAAAPNQVGSPHDKANAEFVLAQFKAWGWNAHIETFDVLYPTPKAEALELLGPSPYQAKLTEPGIEGDSSQNQTGGLPAYLAYGGDGDVTAPLIYVNYGMPADYEALERMGLSVKGKIAIVRYGAGWRGLKPKLAAEHGAVGAIIYSDPADDGYGAGDAYPKGAFRPESGLQRGSVQDLPVEPGDPLTPGWGATAGAKRLPLSEAKGIMPIPVLPISWGEAKTFLSALEGPVVPAGWRGALPMTYHVGGGDSAKVRIMVKSDWSLKTLYDVIAVLPGARQPDQWVVRGNHRDGWVYGASDPLSGHIALMEEAKAIGALVKGGWRPARTLIYASWDGEEPGLLGSTEWAETHAAELQSKAVLYLNSDGNARGFLGAEASYSLRRLVDQAAADVTDPETGATVRARAQAAAAIRAAEPNAPASIRARGKGAAADGDLALGDLGSGSDYTPFVQHLGVASINIGFGGEGQTGGVYHSAYDTFEHFDRFGDPGYAYSDALARTAARIALRAAEADVAPYQFGNVAQSLDSLVEELEGLIKKQRQKAEETGKLLDAKAYDLTRDPTKTSVPPRREAPAPEIDFAPLKAAIGRFKTAAAAFDAAAAQPTDAGKAAKADHILIGVEQTFTTDKGLPGRPWYRHLLYAPGLLTGYGSKTLPGVREAIEAGRWDEAREHVGIAASAVDAATARIESARQALTS